MPPSTVNDEPFLAIWMNEFLAETAGYGACETGAYAWLLLEQFRSGFIPADPDARAVIARCDRGQWPAIWARIGRNFQPVSEGFAHPGYAKRREGRLRMAAGGRSSWKRRTPERDEHGHFSPSTKGPTKGPPQTFGDTLGETAKGTATAKAPPQTFGQPLVDGAKKAEVDKSTPPSTPPPTRDSQDQDQLRSGEDVDRDLDPTHTRDPDRKRVTPPETAMPELPAELEPHVVALVRHLASQNRDGRISVGRIATVRRRLSEAMGKIGDWRFVAYGIDEAIAHGAYDERYVLSVARNVAKRGIPKNRTDTLVIPQEVKALARPPDDFNSWPQPQQEKWLRENGYA